MLRENLYHAYIISAADPGKAEEEARALASAFVCAAGAAQSCGHCAHCKKAGAGTHPDIITIEAPAGARGIPVDLARFVAADACVLPNEAERKVYIIRDADMMAAASQNALLKTLEEPPSRASFILLATVADRLLPTVRSRCVELSLGGEAEGGEAQTWALEFTALLKSGDRLGLAAYLVSLEKYERNEVTAFLAASRGELAALMRPGAERGQLTTGALSVIIEELGDAAARCVRGVGVGTLLGALMAASNGAISALQQNIRNEDI